MSSNSFVNWSELRSHRTVKRVTSASSAKPVKTPRRLINISTRSLFTLRSKSDSGHYSRNLFPAIFVRSGGSIFNSYFRKHWFERERDCTPHKNKLLSRRLLINEKSSSVFIFVCTWTCNPYFSPFRPRGDPKPPSPNYARRRQTSL